MAAFCGCCGAEIKLKAEACPVCGTPFHGMLGKAAGKPVDTVRTAEQVNDGRELPGPNSCKWC